MACSHLGIDVTNACCKSVHGNGRVTDGDADVNMTVISVDVYHSVQPLGDHHSVQNVQ